MSAMSLRQLARVIGVSDTAVRKAERAGVFGDTVKRDAAGEPGVVDVAGAIDAWERSGRQLRGSRARQDEAPAPAVAPATLAAPAAEEGSIQAAGDPDDDADDDPNADQLPLPQSPSLVEATRLAMLERHRRLKLQNDEREGSLVPADRAAKEAFEFSRILRDAILNVPGRIGAQLAAESNATRVHLMLETALREALETTANALEATTSAPAPPPAAA